MIMSVASYPGGLAIHLQASILPGTLASPGPSTGHTLSQLRAFALSVPPASRAHSPSSVRSLRKRATTQCLPSVTLLFKVAAQPFLFPLFQFPHGTSTL